VLTTHPDDEGAREDSCVHCNKRFPKKKGRERSAHLEPDTEITLMGGRDSNRSSPNTSHMNSPPPAYFMVVRAVQRGGTRSGRCVEALGCL
jgi:hypothetical protein